MNRAAAFTILEVLLAIVLLAAVVAVCVPYLHASPPGPDPGALSLFEARVDEGIHAARSSDSRHLTAEQIRRVAAAEGWRFDISVGSDDQEMGRWIMITDGPHSVLRWARNPEPEEQAP